MTHNTSTFDPEKFISDKPLTNSEKTILNASLSKTKAKLFFGRNAAFIASMIATMEFVWDRSIPTACTNGVFMAWNPEFFLSLTPQTRVTVLAHEAWHVAYQHMLRVDDRDREIYNYAADYVINGMLEDHNYDMSGFPFLLDSKYSGMSTEEVYNQLMKNPPPKGGNALDGDFSSPGEGPDSIQGGLSKQDITTQAHSNVVKAATMAKMSKSAGNLPGEVTLMIEEFLNPKMPWQQILLNFFENMTDVGYSYRRINRRYEEPVLPGKIGVEGLEHLIYYLDISGSISDEDIEQFNSEVKYIKDNYNPQKLTLVTFDTQIRDEYVFNEDDEFESITVTGRGGTDLDEVFKHAKANNPTAMVIFTDLYVHIPSEDPKVPLIWICTHNPSATVPYGTLIHME